MSAYEILFLTGDYADYELVINDVSYRVHKKYLTLNSDYFKAKEKTIFTKNVSINLDFFEDTKDIIFKYLYYVDNENSLSFLDKASFEQLIASIYIADYLGMNFLKEEAFIALYNWITSKGSRDGPSEIIDKFEKMKIYYNDKNDKWYIEHGDAKLEYKYFSEFNACITILLKLSPFSDTKITDDLINAIGSNDPDKIKDDFNDWFKNIKELFYNNNKTVQLNKFASYAHYVKLESIMMSNDKFNEIKYDIYRWINFNETEIESLMFNEKDLKKREILCEKYMRILNPSSAKIE